VGREAAKPLQAPLDAFIVRKRSVLPSHRLLDVPEAV
jgi:predicted phosphoribosyltransferase